MKTHTIKIGITFMLLILSVCMPDSLLARRLSLSYIDAEHLWERADINHSFPQRFNYISQVGWAFNTAWKRSRSQGRPWEPNPTAVFAATVLQSDDKQCELYYPHRA